MISAFSAEEWTAVLSGVAAILAYLALRSHRLHDRKRLAFELFRALDEADRAAFSALPPLTFYLLEAADWTRAFESDALQRVMRYFNELDAFARAIEHGVIDRRVAEQLTAPLGRLGPQLAQIIRSIEDAYHDNVALSSAKRLIESHWNTLSAEQRDILSQISSEGITAADAHREALRSSSDATQIPFPLQQH